MPPFPDIAASVGPRGCTVDLDNLHYAWVHGATILAGTALLTTRQAETRVVRACPDCSTWLVDATALGADARLAVHRRVGHGC
jgi:hypothetical protein